MVAAGLVVCWHFTRKLFPANQKRGGPP